MAPNIGSMEILLLAMLALVVLGPRDLPVMLRRFGRWLASARAMASEFRSGIEDIGREAEVEALQEEINASVMEASGVLDDDSGIQEELSVDADGISDHAGRGSS